MANVNKVTVIGRIGSDIELKYIRNGQAVASFSVATSEKFKDKSGQQQEKTEWHNIVAWQKSAELINQYCSKGSEIYIEGKNATRNWEKDNIKHYRTEIVVREFQFIGGKKQENNQQSNNQNQQQNNNQQNNRNNQSNNNNQENTSYDIPDTDFNDDDLPF